MKCELCNDEEATAIVQMDTWWSNDWRIIGNCELNKRACYSIMFWQFGQFKPTWAEHLMTKNWFNPFSFTKKLRNLIANGGVEEKYQRGLKDEYSSALKILKNEKLTTAK